MKKIASILLLCCIPWLLHAQWNTSPDLTHIYNTNSGNVGIGTSTPSAWFPSKTLEIADSRPVLKLTSTIGTGLSTVVFTNNTINTTSHTGEFHVNHVFDPVDNDRSYINFFGYPGGSILTLRANSDVGIGTNTPRGRFDVGGSGDIYLSTDVNTGTSQSIFLPGHIYISPYSGSNVSYLQARRLDNSGSTALRIRTYNSGALVEAVHIESNGNVGIGTVSPDSKLAVKGDIHTREVRVDMSGSVAPDYVFEKNYDLLSLTDLETYIDQNKHLPEVPSAKEMEANGLNLKEMNLLLLKKVEELTLHIIDQQKQIMSLRQELKEK